MSLLELEFWHGLHQVHDNGIVIISAADVFLMLRSLSSELFREVGVSWTGCERNGCLQTISKGALSIHIIFYMANRTRYNGSCMMTW